jgi:Chaperone of endosialidase
MANAVYPKFKQELMKATSGTSLNGTGTTGVWCALCTASYTYSAAHQFYSSLAGVSGTDQELTTKTQVNGTLDGDDLTYTAVASGAAITIMALYVKNAGANTTWPLVLYLDTSQTGLPVTPNGGNITVQWNASGIFTLSDCNNKEGIRQVGKLGRLPLYEYSYLGQKERQLGFIAQEVERHVPDAVRMIGGARHVNYGKAVDWALAA